MKQIFYTLCALLLASSALAMSDKKQERWVVYYSDKLPASAFDDYDVIAFDAEHHPPIESLKAQGKTLLGYISFGEAETYRSYFKDIEKKGLLLGSSKLWEGHYYIDARNPAWADMVINELIPPILAQGFDGIIVDTMDSLIYPEIEDPKKYPGMKQAGIDLMKKVRAAYPDIKIMMNRGLEILPDMAGEIDMVMAESTLTDWVPNPKKPVLVKDETYQYYVNLIEKGQEANPNLKVYSMDYWDMNDIKGVKHIYTRQRAQGWIPYVSTKELNLVHPEPK